MKTVRLARAFLVPCILSVPAVLVPVNGVLAADDHPLPIESAVKETVRMTENGLVPKNLTLRKRDGSVFFVNTTREGLASLEITFGEKAAHCASENLKFENGVMHSVKPIGPRDFGLLCFPDAGDYPVTVRGLDGTAKAQTATITVE